MNRNIFRAIWLDRNIYPRWSETGCSIPEFATTDHFLNEMPCQTYKRKLKTLELYICCSWTDTEYKAITKPIGLESK